MSLVKTTALILKTTNFFEHDKRCECFSPTLGKLTCLAKYATKSKKKSWALEPLSIVNLTLFKGKSFYIINQYSVTEYFDVIRSSFNLIQYGLFYLNIIKNTIHEDQENHSLFNLIKTTLSQLNSNQTISQTTINFLLSYIKLEGFEPDNSQSLSTKQAHSLITNYLGKHIAFPIQLDELTQTPVK